MTCHTHGIISWLRVIQLTKNPIALEELGETGMHMYCADDRVRHCFPILACGSADYEEQVLITGIRSGQQRPNCQVEPGE